jgi:proteasome accessory factor A
VLEKWQYTLEALERDPSELETKLDWVAKKMLVEGFMERKGLDWESPQVQMLDLQYHDSRPDKGLYYMLERQDKIERIVSDDEINAAVHTPPSDTRAYFRGECLRRYPGEVFGVNWDSISFGFGDEPVKRIMMSEPLKGTKVYVEELLNKSANAAELLANMSA